MQLLADDSLAVARFVDGELQPFASDPKGLSRSVALVDGAPSRAYWISKGRLVRRRISADGVVGPLEILADDAADHTIVAAASAHGPVEADVALYIGKHVTRELERKARLWVERDGSRALSDEAGGATTVSIVPLGGAKFALLTIDGRLAMSPVHAVYLELDADGKPHLGVDQVVYVAGPADRDTRITGIRVGLGPVGLVAMARDSSSFGLLTLRIGYGEGEAPSWWLDYPNGLNPAPVVAAQVCGQPMVFFVRPVSSDPRAEKALESAVLQPDATLGRIERLAVAPTIRSVSAMGSDNGKGSGWVAYAVPDGLQARQLSCKRGK